MDLNPTLAGLFVLFLCLYLEISCNRVEGGMVLSPQEHLEIEKELKLLNKPAVKSIKTDHGHMFDCVDFYKQPAFDHPLLKNHSYHFKMKPQFRNENFDKISGRERCHFSLKGGGCPTGTVPIRRITKKDLIREKFASKSVDFGGTYKTVACLQEDGLSNTGALGFLSIYKQQVLESQYSASRITIQNGNEMMEFGLRVDPSLYGDNALHFYVHTNTSTMQCFDARCGFVVTDRNLSPGLPIAANSLSVVGKNIYELKLRVQRDNDGNWWLSVRRNNRRVGFWPSKLFTSLADSATYIDWGGEVYSPYGQYVPLPPMGSGIKPLGVGNVKINGYFRWIAAIDTSGNNFSPDKSPKTHTFNTDQQSINYGLQDVLMANPVWGHTVFFGGTN